MPSLRLSRALLAEALAHARAGAPEEVCGVLVGRREKEERGVLRIAPTTNVNADPRAEYTIAPDELLRIALAAEEEGLDVVGFYHSHPAGPATMSAIDRARGSWPGAAYLLLWLAPEEGARSWVWMEEERAFAPAELVIRP